MGASAPKSTAALATALLAVSVLAACGGDSTTTATPISSQTNTAGNSVESGPLKVVGGGSASYLIRGHHTSVPSFGEEASEAELRDAAVTEHGYLVARVEENWPKACSYVSKGLEQELASRSKKPTGEDCATILSTVTVPGPGGSDYESSEVEAESLRAKGNRAFLLYRAATAPYFMPMIREGGAWKVNSLDPTPFY